MSNHYVWAGDFDAVLQALKAGSLDDRIEELEAAIANRKEQFQHRFYAITGIGWGRGETPHEAEVQYHLAQRRSFPHLKKDEIAEFWGFVWETPPGTEGFWADSSVHWKLSDGTAVDAEPSQKVRNIGAVPEQWAVA